MRPSPGTMQRILICLMVIFSGTAARKSSLPGQDRLLIRLRQLTDVVDRLQNYVNDLGPESLIAPEDVKKVQLKAASAGDSEKVVSVLAKQLTRRLPPTDAGSRRKQRPMCPSCDSYEKKPPKEFLERLKSLIQKMTHQLLS